MLELNEDVESFVGFCCNFFLSALVVFGLDTDCFGRWDVVKTWRLVGNVWILFVHFLYLFHDLISLLLKKSNAPRLILNSLL